MGHEAWPDIKRTMEERHRRKLGEALRTAKHGTTFEIDASCSAPMDGFVITTSICSVDRHKRSPHPTLERPSGGEDSSMCIALQVIISV